MKRVAVLFIILFIISAVACRSGKKQVDSSPPSSVAYSMAGGSSPGTQLVSGSNQTSSGSRMISTRKIIRKANLAIKVNEISDAYTTTIKMIQDYDAYVQQGRITLGNTSRASLTVRISEDDFFRFLEATDELGTVENRDISGNDVTDECIDLDAELETKKQLRDRLLGFLKRARNVSEMLEVEKELERVEYDIARISARLNQLESSVTEATINIQLYTESKTPRKPLFQKKLFARNFAYVGRLFIGIIVIILWLVIILVPLGAVILSIFKWVIPAIGRWMRKK